MYNWQHKLWPEFKYNHSILEDALMRFMIKSGELKGIISALPEDIGTETIIQIMVAEAIKTSEIEGEIYNRADVMSSMRKNLGLAVSNETKDKNTIGLSKLLIDVRKSFQEPLTEKKLLDWHKLLLGTSKRINAGQWRTGSTPMQVISGSVAKPTVHFEAPPSNEVPMEMKRFIAWYNQDNIKSPIIKAAIAHLYFESIHPFEDGNGRIGRAISEKAISQGLNSPILFSISKSIEKRRAEYYKALQDAQRKLDINQWLEWFSSIMLEAQENAEQTIQFTVKKVKFFDQHDQNLNERQRKVINRILEEGVEGFKGGMNVKKYLSITNSSKATATRDLQNLVEMNIFTMHGGSRSIRYEIQL